jgi:hypothetical protein
MTGIIQDILAVLNTLDVLILLIIVAVSTTILVHPGRLIYRMEEENED